MGHQENTPLLNGWFLVDKGILKEKGFSISLGGNWSYSSLNMGAKGGLSSHL